MKTLIAIPCLLNGGTERQTLMLSTTLGSLGHAVTVLCYFEFDPEIVSEFEKAGAEVSLLSLNRKSNFVKIISRLKKEIRSIKPDVVHVQYIAPGALPIIASRFARVRKVFATVHQPYRMAYGRFSRIILRCASLLTTKFICVSQNAERSWFGSSNLFDENRPLKSQPHHFTIYNAVDVNEIQRVANRTVLKELKKRMSFSDDNIIIGAVSRLRHEKGIDLLVEAFIQLAKNHANIRLLIVGKGPDGEFLQKMVKDSVASTQVIFYGVASWEHAMELLSVMDIVVVPSRFEGFGLTAAEAMAVGKPVIASDTSGLREVVNNNHTGLLWPVNDIPALKGAIEKLISDPQLRGQFGSAGIERVLSNFSFGIYTKKIQSLYNN